MEMVTTGRVVVPATIENLHDLLNVHSGQRQPERVRSVEIPDALVDTGAMVLLLPKRLIGQLGLIRLRTKQTRTSAGFVEFGMYAPVRLTVQGRDCDVEVAEVPDNCPVLIGQIPLELLDFLIDPVNHRLIGNPDHGGEHMMDMF